jgi:hypothetical protein
MKNGVPNGIPEFKVMRPMTSQSIIKKHPKAEYLPLGALKTLITVFRMAKR